jgi:3-deoxy-manno-octulosonate cytidylyltransferase (CMP-KDO synthetase)
VTSALVIIPARLESRRLPRKLLQPIGQRSLIEWTWIAACRSGFDVLIATDSTEIAHEVQRFGGECVMTGPAANGTERCAAVAERLPKSPGIIINWQGDCPLAPPLLAVQLHRALSCSRAAVTTPVQRAEVLPSRHAVAVLRSDRRALYFSRQPVPTGGPFWAHIGMYAYLAEVLPHYGTKPGQLEQAEGLEQLRWLERGVEVECVPVDFGFIREVNEQADVAPVEQALSEVQ